MNGFEKRRLQKMEQILHAALSLFTKNGFQKVSIKDVAEKANVSQVSIYNYFGNKDELLFEVVKFYLEEQLNAFQKIMDHKELSFKEKIGLIIGMKLQETISIHDDFLKAIFSSPSPKLQKLISDFATKDSLPSVYAFLQEGKDSGEISASYSPETILLITQIFNEGIRHFPEMYTGINKKERIQEITEFFFYGFFGKKE
ncbi:TetR family transcriptional regulator [Bacillus oleivorans]|uniref:TetR family transcriptional regulator n=1 Tax=Bacillus oleivorans TaxID=1448271 RepID=A0A285CQY2_9BACI|nr:TetR/AcrR family transcriptional regulator [Bacillus oleivorans]SNX69942.1 TetR family transcriptional regulator [Bacillus oleivorans]